MTAAEQNVFYVSADKTLVGSEWIDQLKNVAVTSPLRRARLCLHQSEQDSLHEMIIALARDCLFPPHRHLVKIESYHMIFGRMVLIIFGDDGTPIWAAVLTSPQQGGPVCYRLGKSLFHAILPLDDVVVFHEVTNGPFNRGEAILAPWAPKESSALRGFLNKAAASCGVDGALLTTT